MRHWVNQITDPRLELAIRRVGEDRIIAVLPATTRGDGAMGDDRQWPYMVLPRMTTGTILGPPYGNAAACWLNFQTSSYFRPVRGVPPS